VSLSSGAVLLTSCMQALGVALGPRLSRFIVSVVVRSPYHDFPGYRVLVRISCVDATDHITP
jgi:hypothetical protein